MLNLDEDQIIRAGYPANMFNKAEFRSFDHSIKRHKGLNAETKVVLYAPTFRDYKMNNFLVKLYLIWQKLLKTLKKNNILLIIKLHYLVKNDVNFTTAKKCMRTIQIFCFGIIRKTFMKYSTK